VAQLKPLVVLVGPTASGKSELALELAEHFGGEIVCADARTIYRHMDIGTAKPSVADQARVPHHMLDIIEPDKTYSAANFQAGALAVIKDIHARGRLPIMVGGTGLYIDAVLFDYSFRPKADMTTRRSLEVLSVGELQRLVTERGLPLPNNPRNPVHLIRLLETGGVPAVRQPLRDNTLVIGLDIEPTALKQRIAARVQIMVAAGLKSEVKRLADTYGWSAPGLRTIGYHEWYPLFNGEATDEIEIEQMITKNTISYAKRQRTWFRRNNRIQWANDPSKVVEITTTFLNKTT
jgi:tRNA dimethylallyltransferase